MSQELATPPEPAETPTRFERQLRDALSWLAARLRVVSQIAALFVALFIGRHAYEMVLQDRFKIDQAALWYLAALALIAYFAWDGVSRPNITRWPAAVGTYVRDHPVELALLAVICAGGAFMRLYKPAPDGYIVLEEHIRAGVSWGILNLGQRPYIYPIPNYLGAVAQWIYGDSTLGLRAHSIAAGILTVPVFYLLLREVVDRPAALFATAIFASLRVLGDTMVAYQTPTLAQVLMIWFTIRGLRTNNLVWFVPAAALAAILSYEYETSKALPLFTACFLVWFAFRSLAWPLPRTPAVVFARIRERGPRALKAVVAIAAVVLILLGPMRADYERNINIYFSSLDRQQADRDARGRAGFFAHNATEQIEWAARVYTPWLDPNYTTIPGTIPSPRGAIDGITSSLIWAALIAGALMFWRGYRAMFFGWFAGGILFAALLLSNFEAWKVIGFLPPALVLVAFLAQDAVSLVKRFGDRARYMLFAAMAVTVAAVFALNVDTLRGNAADPYAVREYGNDPSRLYTICDQLNDRPDGTYAYVTQWARPGWGFAKPHRTPLDKLSAFVDFRFICWDLRGEAAGHLAEVWPMYRTSPGPVSLLTVARHQDASYSVEALARVLPGLGEPDDVRIAPGNTFESVRWDTDDKEINAHFGLYYREFDSRGAVIAEHILPGYTFQAPEPAPDAASWSMTGLVYLPHEIVGTLVPADTAADITITADAIPAYGEGAQPRPFVTGWHLVEIRGEGQFPQDLQLRWRGDDVVYAPFNYHYFALKDTALWKHNRIYVLPDGTNLRTVRYDVKPHVATFDGLRIDPIEPLPLGTRVGVETWTGRVVLDQRDTYRFVLAETGAQTRVALSIDGVTRIDTTAATGDRPEVDVQLEAGPHAIEIIFTSSTERRIGGYFYATSASGRAVDLSIR